MKSDQYFWTYVFLGIGIIGFSLKLFTYVSGVGIIGALAIIMSQPKKYSKLFLLASHLCITLAILD